MSVPFSLPGTVCTPRIHPPTRGTQPWWRNGLIYDFRGFLDSQGVQAATAHLPWVAHLGATAVELRPAFVQLGKDQCLRQFVQAAHKIHLKVIVRVSGNIYTHEPVSSSNPACALGYEAPDPIRHLSAALEAGADGIDLGMLANDSSAPELFSWYSEYMQNARSEVTTFIPHDGLLAASATTNTQEGLQGLLTADYLDQVRDDGLIRVEFEAIDFLSTIVTTIRDHNTSGSGLAWSITPPSTKRWRLGVFDDLAWYKPEHDSISERIRAVTSLVLALPGCVYMRSGEETAKPELITPEFSPEVAAESTKLIQDTTSECELQAEDSSSAFSTAVQASSLRRHYQLGESSWSWVEAEAYPRNQVLVATSGSLVTVFNTSNTTQYIPQSMRRVHVSAPSGVEAIPSVEPGSCAWFRPVSA
ncbi:hypothetical protein HMPREF2851_07790 [Actinomyces sp. HMSC064C12]|nr:hypothetical protein HMPREF2851_07790 [Actinomyces sp. HMSC064C12]